MLKLFPWSWRKRAPSPPEPPSQPRIFISYARADGRAFADALRANLKARGLEPWQDLVAMQSGDWRAPNLLQALTGATTALTGKPSMVGDVNAAVYSYGEGCPSTRSWKRKYGGMHALKTICGG